MGNVQKKGEKYKIKKNRRYIKYGGLTESDRFLMIHELQSIIDDISSNKFITIEDAEHQINYTFKFNKPTRVETLNIQYSIHFLWLNKKFNPSQKYIFTNLQFILNIIEWIKLNPEKHITIWHDVNDDIVQNTKKIIYKAYELIRELPIWPLYATDEQGNILRDKMCKTRQYNYNVNTDKIPELEQFILEESTAEESTSEKSIPELEYLHFRNIYTNLDILQLNDENSLVFNSKNEINNKYQISVYYRVDLCRLIILLQVLRENPLEYVIYADLDTKPISQHIFFESDKSHMEFYGPEDIQPKTTIELLHEYGIVLPMAAPMDNDFENSIHIMSNDNPNMIISIQKMLIELNLKKCICWLNSNTLDFISPQEMYGGYYDMFEYYDLLQNNTLLEFNVRQVENHAIFEEMFKIKSTPKMRRFDEVKNYINVHKFNDSLLNIDKLAQIICRKKQTNEGTYKLFKQQFIYPVNYSFFQLSPKAGIYN